MIRRIIHNVLPRKALSARSQPRRILRGSLRLLLWAGLGWVVLTLLLILPLRWLAPPTTSFMLQEQRAQSAEIAYTWVPYEQIAAQMALAAVAGEDQKFPEHFGFDIASIRQAWTDYRNGRTLRGASTITQQLCKNLYLWSGRSLLRKGLEAWCTVWVEALWPKQRILEVYLNIVELGAGVFGVEAASRRYFGIPAARLTAEQAALLAAVLPNPKTYSVIAPGRRVRNRQAWILRQMRQLGGVSYITDL